MRQVGVAILPQRPPGLLRSWLTARKRRVCPLLEVVD